MDHGTTIQRLLDMKVAHSLAKAGKKLGFNSRQNFFDFLRRAEKKGEIKVVKHPAYEFVEIDK